MDDNVQKFRNWKAITESDYVTMFIKTWFSFIATLREMHPKDSLDEIIGKGDSVFINPYLDEFEPKILSYLKLESILSHILETYKLGRQYVLTNPKYYRFYQEDFFFLNKSFKYQKKQDLYELTIHNNRDCVLKIHVKYLQKDYCIENKPLIIECEVDFSDWIKRTYNKVEADHYLEDEGAFINAFAEDIKKRASKAFINAFMAVDVEKKYPKTNEFLKTLSVQNINNDIYQCFAPMQATVAVSNEELLYMQVPCQNFIYMVNNKKTVNEIAIYKWFIRFVYFLRNALFHEIIDPLDEFWQNLFKNAYLALKEILDANIEYFIVKDKIKGLLFNRVLQEFREKPEIYIPNLNEHNNNGEPEIMFEKYKIKEARILIEATVNYEYWYDNYTIRKTKTKLEAEYEMISSKLEEQKIKMELVDYVDTQIV